MNPEMELRRLLLVDDDDALRTAMQVRLEAEGFEVTTAADGRSALAKALRERPDVVLLDVDLPGIDGLELQRTLFEQLPADQRPIVLFVTGRAVESACRQEYTPEATVFFAKPVEIRDLIHTIQEAGRERARRSAA